MTDKPKPNKHGTTTICVEDFSRWNWDYDEVDFFDKISEAAAKIVIAAIAEDAELGLRADPGEDVFITLFAFEFELHIEAPLSRAIDIFLSDRCTSDGFADQEDLQPLIDALDAARARLIGKIRAS